MKPTKSKPPLTQGKHETTYDYGSRIGVNYIVPRVGRHETYEDYYYRATVASSLTHKVGRHEDPSATHRIIRGQMFVRSEDHWEPIFKSPQIQQTGELSFSSRPTQGRIVPFPDSGNQFDLGPNGFGIVTQSFFDALPATASSSSSCPGHECLHCHKQWEGSIR